MDALVSTQWLAAHLNEPKLIIADASWFLPADDRDAQAEFEAQHIKGAVFFDITGLKVGGPGSAFGLLDETQSAQHFANLGFGLDRKIILYDNSPYHSAARAWFLLTHVYQFPEVAILDGGFAKWIAEKRAIEVGPGAPRHASVQAITADFRHLVTKEDVLRHLDEPLGPLVDARGPGRFSGQEPEPRPDMTSGHIPGAQNLHYAKLFDDNGCWKKGDAMEAVFKAADVDLSAPLIASCGSGITACIILFGAHMLGKRDFALYEGSWAEWGSDPLTPKEREAGKP